MDRATWCTWTGTSKGCVEKGFSDSMSFFQSPSLQMVLKINGIFEARRGKKRMKRVSQSTESSSGRGWRSHIKAKDL